MDSFHYTEVGKEYFAAQPVLAISWSELVYKIVKIKIIKRDFPYGGPADGVWEVIRDGKKRTMFREQFDNYYFSQSESRTKDFVKSNNDAIEEALENKHKERMAAIQEANQSLFKPYR